MITIIVLLILAGVTIATLTGDNGLLSKATTAKNTANDAEIGEKIRLAYQDYYLGQHTTPGYSFQDALDKIFGTGVATASGPDSNGVYTVSVNGKIYEFNPATKSIQPVTTAWTKNEDGSYSTGEGAEKITLQVGDYVNYDPTEGATTGLTYTSEAATNGYEDQSFNAATYKSAGYRWRVLDIKNGKIRLISEEYVGPGNYSDQSRTTYYLQGQAGYINGISELNNISSIFGHGKGAESATSITVEDINGITGFNPNSPKYNQGDWDEYGNTVTYTYNGENNYTATRTNGASAEENTNNIGSSNFYYFDNSSRTFKDLTSGSTQITSTNYWKNYGENASAEGRLNSDGTFNTQHELIFGKWEFGSSYDFGRTFRGTREHRYWLASPYADAGSYYVYWGLRNVYGGDVGSNSLYNSNGRENSNDYGVRPVVSLKSNVNIQWNATANEWQIQ